MPYCVYWIHRPGHTDLLSEGYIGITNNFRERMKAHHKSRRTTPLTRARERYGWTALIKQQLAVVEDREAALEMERKLRPHQRIGWNLLEGGTVGVTSDWYDDTKNRLKHSKATAAATRKAIAEEPEGARSERARESWKRSDTEARRKLVRGANNPRAKLTEDQVRAIKHELLPAGESVSSIATKYDVGKHVIYFIRSGKNWSHV